MSVCLFGLRKRTSIGDSSERYSFVYVFDTKSPKTHSTGQKTFRISRSSRGLPEPWKLSKTATSDVLHIPLACLDSLGEWLQLSTNHQTVFLRTVLRPRQRGWCWLSWLKWGRGCVVRWGQKERESVGVEGRDEGKWFAGKKKKYLKIIIFSCIRTLIWWPLPCILTSYLLSSKYWSVPHCKKLWN